MSKTPGYKGGLLLWAGVLVLAALTVLLIWGAFAGGKALQRQQKVLDARNEIQVNAIWVEQMEQSTNVEKQAAIIQRQEKVLAARNEVQVNAIRIEQTEQLVDIEKQAALIRIEEAKGIAEAQRIIDATLTPQYLQYQAMQAQTRMADSPNPPNELNAPAE